MTRTSLFILAALLLAAPLVAASNSTTGTKRFLDCTLDSRSIDDCDAVGYVIRVGTYFVPAVILAILTLLFCPCFFIGRYVCNCCGGRSSSSGCCCGSTPAIYSMADVVRPKVFAIIIVLAGIGFSVWGITGSGIAVNGLYGFADDIESTPELLQKHINEINSALTVQQYDAATDTTTTQDMFSNSDLAKTSADLKQNIKDAMEDYIAMFRDYVSKFSTVMFVVFGIPLVAVVIGGIASLCNIRSCVPMFLVFIMFFMCVVMWLGHGLFSSFALAAGDLCAEVHGITLDQKTIMPSVMQCDDALFTSFRSQFRSIESQVAETACEALDKVCYDNTKSAFDNGMAGQIYDCPGGSLACTATMRFSDVLSYMNTGLSMNAQVKALPSAQTLGFTCRNSSLACSPSECAENCLEASGNLSYAGKATKSVVVAVGSAYSVATALDTLGGQYGSCEAMLNLVFGPFDSSCTKFADGTFQLRQAAGLGGIIIYAFLFVMTWGSKRFISLSNNNDDAGLPVEGEMTAMPEESTKKL